MADLIDRQAAIDAVRSYYDECDEQEESIEERIERLPSAGIDLNGFSDKLWHIAYERGKAEEVRWIPCKERLPDDGVNVLVQFIDGYTEICRLLGGCWEVLYGEYTGIHTAVAWMPLPEPYKGGD